MKDESGQGVLPLVLILVVLGSLIIIPLLAFMSTGLKAGHMHEDKTQRYYAADAGAEDAMWQIKNNQLDILFPGYDSYDYATPYPYTLADNVSGKNVDITIENAWIPKGISAPESYQAEEIIQQANLVMVGSISGESEYQIKISYYYDEVGDPNGENLEVETIGIWLPPGCHYDDEGPCNLVDGPDTAGYAEPSVESHCSGEAVVWDFGLGVPLIDFPDFGGTGYPLTKVITFQFVPPPQAKDPVSAVSWMETDGVDDMSVSVAWDADIKVYNIVSTATTPATGKQTVVDTYITKTVPRELGTTITGDYRAVGNTLMIDQYHDYGGPRRDTLLDESDAAVSDIPSDARVDGAYLYWTAWLSGAGEQILFVDGCSDFSDWANPGSDWRISSRRFSGHHQGSEDHRYLALEDSLDMSAYSGETVTVRWDQSTSSGWYVDYNDCLKFEFSGDGGNSWGGLITAFCDGNPPYSFSYDIPDEYLTDSFKMRFYLHNFSGRSEYVYIDNICIAATQATIADTLVTFKINGQQVYLYEDGEPQQGAQEITASKWTVLDNEPGEYSYACYRDVTKLIQAFSDLGDGQNHTGNGVYTVGEVNGDTGDEWSYAAWSLIIIYSSAQTERRQLYLYDDFIYSGMDQNVDFDGDGMPGGIITHFLAPDPVEGETEAARLTCFVGEGDDYYNGDSILVNGNYLSNAASPWNDVWNSASPELTEDGIDIDTFEISWASGIIEPGDTSAQVDLPTETDSWNLVYIILCFRSEINTGGTISYLVRG